MRLLAFITNEAHFQLAPLPDVRESQAQLQRALTHQQGETRSPEPSRSSPSRVVQRGEGGDRGYNYLCRERIRHGRHLLQDLSGYVERDRLPEPPLLD
jgi:hypothetical protein